MRIMCNSFFINAAARPGIIFLYPISIDCPIANCKQKAISAFPIQRDSNGDIIIGDTLAKASNWVDLNIKLIPQIYGVALDNEIARCLCFLDITLIPNELYHIQSAQIASLSKSLEVVSHQNSDLFSEVYALRLSVENSLSAQFELQETVRRRGPHMPWIETSLPLDAGDLHIGPGRTEVEQSLAIDPKGVAGFDLHLGWPRCEAMINLTARLFVLDSGAQVSEWNYNLRAKAGWVHFRLDKALADVGYGLALKLYFDNSSDQTDVGRITLTNVETKFGADVQVDGVQLAGRSLAFRLWKAPMGMIMSHTYNESIYAQRKERSAIAWSMGLNHKIRTAIPLEPLISLNSSHPNLVVKEADFLQIHPVPCSVTMVRLPNAFESVFREIVADVGVYHENGPYVQFSLGVVPSEINNGDLEKFEESDFVTFSGWVTANGQIRTTVSVALPDNAGGNFDLVLATKMLEEGSTDYAWARFSNIRGAWHPDHAYPVSFSPPTDFEPLKLLRDQVCERRKNFQLMRQPKVSLACCVHRPVDLHNLIKQLSKQEYSHLEILVALNGLQVSTADCTQIAQSLPNAKVWMDDGKNLPVVLNNIIDRATGDYLIKIDADDIYGSNFIVDLVMEATITGAAIVGKSCFGVSFVNQNCISFHRSHPFYQYVPQVAGGTMCIRTDVLREIKFDESYESGEDYKLQQDFASNGYRIWSSDPFNYLHIRRNDQSSHTWKSMSRDYKPWPNFRAYTESDSWLFFI